ncbi:MAG TPA: O-antigen ligase family protein, partial [Planctomycetaceae bacterium]
THSDRRWLSVISFIYIFALIDAGIDQTFDPDGGRAVPQGPVTAHGTNFVSPHAVAFLPLVVLLAATPELRLWLRFALVLGTPFIMNLIAHASSRGAFLALLAAGGAMVLFTRGRYRLLTVAAGAGGTLLAMRLFHDRFWARMATILSPETDGSAMGRKEAWAAARKLAERNPFGYGGEAFDSGLGARLMGEEAFHTTHNMFYEILVAWGAQGVLLFYGFIAVSLWDCYRLQRRHWRPGEWPQPRTYVEATGILCGMLSMLVASLFVNRLAWELWWVFPAYVVCLKNLAEQVDEAAGDPDDEPDELPADADEAVRVVGT